MPETLAKLSASRRGKSKSPEHRPKLSLATTLRALEMKAKMGRHIGWKHTPEARAKMDAAKKLRISNG